MEAKRVTHIAQSAHPAPLRAKLRRLNTAQWSLCIASQTLSNAPKSVQHEINSNAGLSRRRGKESSLLQKVRAFAAIKLRSE
eukprot:4452373-Pleurochrysis_carterae.AAC.2